MRNVSVIIPTFNESENIVKLIDQILALHYKYILEIIVVDDNSPDKTGLLVQKTYVNNPRVRSIVRRRNPDLGKSILLGVEHARGSIILGIDGDFNHDVRSIPLLVHKLKDADLVVASRFVKGGGMQKPMRYWGSYVFNMLLKVLFRFPIIDNTSGYYAIWKKTLLALSPKDIYYGYGEYSLRLLFFAQQEGLSIKEVPVYYKAREYGKSKSYFPYMIFTYLKTAIELHCGKKNY